jgi:nicotinamide-nucleotide amidase
MKASIVAIGDELLIGQVLDTNSSWLASELTKQGIKVQSVSVIADQASPILSALESESKQSDIIIFTGGLGPTKDDITKETLADYFGVGLRTDQDTLDRISSWFAKRGIELIEENIDQAKIPENCTVLPNYVGTAPGMWFDHQSKIIVSLPGVPYEMMELFVKEVLPRILEKRGSEEAIEHRTLVVSGIPESLLSKHLNNFEARLPEGLQLSYLPNFQNIRLRLTNYKPVSNDLSAVYSDLRSEVREYLIAEGDKQIVEIIGDMLLAKQASVSFAESCTGGNIAHEMTSVPGSSRYFEGGIVAYSYNIKESNLGIDHKFLVEHGAVSPEVVEAMATAIRRRMNTDFALAVSGIAGPGGGTPSKPVGTVWIAVCDKNSVHSRVFHFRGDRQKVIRHTTSRALDYLRELISGKLEMM